MIPSNTRPASAETPKPHLSKRDPEKVMKINVRCSALFLMVALAPASAVAADPADYHASFPPFNIAGNLYYVGTADLAVYLIQTPAGNILINSDYPFDLPLIRRGIAKLGFNYRDTKIILISHAHLDHDGAVGEIQKETHGQLMVMDADVPDVESPLPNGPGAKVDRILHDGDHVELGGSTLTARLTPGHTKGCTTWTMSVHDGARQLNAVIIGSPNVNPGYLLVGNKEYPRIADDYVKTFEVLKSLHADLFLGAHGQYFGLKEKYKKMKNGAANPFIDPAGYRNYVAAKESAFRAEWERQKRYPGSPAP
jgi:metallo-beta-lactamase class B